MKLESFKTFEKQLAIFKKLPKEQLKFVGINVGIKNAGVGYPFALENFNIDFDNTTITISGNQPYDDIQERYYPSAIVIELSEVGWLYIKEEINEKTKEMDSVLY